MAELRSLSLQLDEHLYERLTRAAVSRSLGTSDAAAQAIEAWLEADVWQRAEIEAAIAEADREDFASDEEVAAIFDKWASSRSG